MRILVLCYEYPPVGGGGGRVARQFALALAKRGHDVRVLTGGTRGTDGSTMEDGIIVRRISAGRLRPDTCSVWEMARWLAAAALPSLRLTMSWKPEVVHAHFAVPTGALAWLLQWAAGVPYVLTTHLGDVPGGVPGQTDNLFRWLKPFTIPIWKSASSITAVSSFVAELGQKAYRCKPAVIPNALPGDPWEPAPLLKGAGEFRLIFVGRFSIQKNPLLAAQAVSLAATHIQNLRLDFVGDGPLLPEVREFIRGKGMESRVRFLGWLPAEKVRELMLHADALLMTSQSEGFPVTILEALACGLPVISTKIPGVRDAVEDRVTGILCEASPEKLSDEIQLLAANPSLRTKMASEARKKAEEFRENKIALLYEEELKRAAK